MAREYGIRRARNGVATRRIVDGQTVLVNGDAGLVSLVGGDHGAITTDAVAARRFPRAGAVVLAGASVAALAWLFRRRAALTPLL